MSAVFKTISQMELETTKEEKCYDQTELARMIALVAFLKEMESHHGCDFKILYANPQLTENAHWLCGNSEDKHFTLGTFARIAVKNAVHLVDTKGISFSNKAHNASPETVGEIVDDLREMFADIIAL